MSPQNTEPSTTFHPQTVAEQKCPWYQPLCQVTLVSKYLALSIFIVLPFVGGYMGYQTAKNDTPINPYTEWAIKVPVPEFSTEEIKQLRAIQLENKQKSITDATDQINDELAVKNATSSVTLSASKHCSPTAIPPATNYSYGTKFGDFSLTSHTRSCTGYDYSNRFIFSGTTTIRGIVSADYGYEQIHMMAVTDPEYLKKFPSKENGITEIDPKLYNFIYAPELDTIFDELEKDFSKVFLVEFTISGFDAQLSEKGPAVVPKIIDVPRIIKTTSKE